MSLPHGDAERHVTRRIVEVSTGDAAASGYAVGPDLVLTSRRTVSDSGACFVRVTPQGPWLSASVVWQGSDTTDAALLRTQKPISSQYLATPARWACAEDTKTPCTVTAVADTDSDPQLVHVTGYIDPFAGVSPGRFHVTLPPQHEDEPATGRFVGGPVLADACGQLLGIVTDDPAMARTKRMSVVRASSLLTDPQFARLVDADLTDLEPVGGYDEVGWLSQALHPASHPLLENCPSWCRLLPAHAEVGFIPRDDTIQRLNDWCDTRRDFSVAIVTGDAGVGKTRLATMLCEQRSQAGWDAGFCNIQSLRSLINLRHPLEATRPTLLVVDQPETLTSDVAALINMLSERKFLPPVRLLLSARADASANGVGASPWLQQLRAGTQRHPSALSRPTVVALNQHPLSLSERGQHRDAALAAFGAGSGAKSSLPSWDFEPYRFPFPVHLAALLAASGHEVPDGEHPVDVFWRQQEHAWRETFTEYFAVEWQQQHLDVLRRALAVVVATAPRAEAVHGLLANMPTHGLDAETLSRWVVDQFPTHTPTLDYGLRLLSESLLSRMDDLFEVLDAALKNPHRNGHHLSHMLEVLLSACDEPVILTALFRLVNAHLPMIVAEAFGQTYPILADTVDSCLQRLCSSEQHAQELAATAAELMPDSSWGTHLGLRATLTGLKVQNLSTRDGVAPETLAGQRTDLAAHTAATGRFRSGSQHAIDAVSAYRESGVDSADVGLAEHNAAACLLADGDSRNALKYASDAAQRFDVLSQRDSALADDCVQAHVTVAIAAFMCDDLTLSVTSIASAVEVLRESDEDLIDLFESVVRLLEQVGINRGAPLDSARNRPVRPREERPTGLRDSIITLACEIVAALQSALPQRDDLALAEPLVDLAVKLIDLDRQGLAYELLDTAIALVRQHGNEQSRQLLHRAGLIRCAVPRREPARVLELAALLREQLLDAGTEPDGRVVAQLFEAEGTALTFLGRVAEATVPLRQAIDYYTAVSDQVRLGELRILLGQCLQELDQHAIALAQFDHAVAIFTDLTGHDRVYIPRLEKAMAFQEFTQMAAPEEDFSGTPMPASVDHAADVLDWVLRQAHTLDNADPHKLAAGETQLHQLQQQLIENVAVDPQTAYAYVGTALAVARAHADTGRAADGIDVVNTARRVSEAHLPDNTLREILQLSLTTVAGCCLVELGDTGNAVDVLRHALGLRAYLDGMTILHDTVFEIEFALARAHRLDGRIIEARDALHRALDASELSADLIDIEPARGRAMATLALVTLDLGDVAESVLLADEALEALGDGARDHPVAFATAHTVLAAGRIVHEEFAEASTHVEQAMHVVNITDASDDQLSMLTRQLTGVANYRLGNEGATEHIFEATDAAHAVFETGGSAYPAVLWGHANGCVYRADVHRHNDEREEALQCLTEAMWALSFSGLVSLGEQLVGAWLVPIWFELCDEYRKTPQSAQVTELFSSFGEHTARLLESTTSLSPQLVTTLTSLASIATAGELPEESNDAFAETLDSMDHNFDTASGNAARGETSFNGAAPAGKRARHSAGENLEPQPRRAGSGAARNGGPAQTVSTVIPVPQNARHADADQQGMVGEAPQPGNRGVRASRTGASPNGTGAPQAAAPAVDPVASAEVLWSAAQALRDSGRLDEAANCLQEIVRIGHSDSDRHTQARLMLANTLLEADQAEPAITEARQLAASGVDVSTRSQCCLIWATAAGKVDEGAAAGPLLAELSAVVTELDDGVEDLDEEEQQELHTRVSESLAAVAALWKK
ncbi:MAG TPA: hypothetical protein H9902_12320 [Candidatus Stackebrandtia faecavium]|nr:hypothetical protein [Candidatus Stackebrandtia faecavium]